MKKENLTILKTSDSSNDEAIWAKKHGKAKDLAGDSPEKDAIRKECEKATIEKTEKEDNYEEIYKSYVKVCTRQKGE